jgi:hypothetical protein
MRIKSVNLYTLLFVITVSNNCVAQIDSIYGVWKITKCISDDYHEPVLSKEEQLREIGRKVIITPERLIVSFKEFSDTCLNPTFVVSDDYIANYFKDDKQMISWLGFTQKQKVEIIKTKCESFWFKRFFRARNKNLIMRAEGFFYYLKKELSFSSPNVGAVNVKKEISFIINQTNFENEKAAIDSLKYISNLLKKNASLITIISGNTDNKSIDLNSRTTINGKNGVFKDLLLARADAVAKVLINLGASPGQIITRVGQVGNKRTTTVEILKY